ncbi:hypothetical protein CC1G_07142 [Coprinopsis cinerea okayama7|uniref:Metallo-beta-lactamase domain-containing protein n=1 Tax=Coprinopsis cinerea (strain Okayama-7 / 130 / ATCC MYA-4618 / FGSC 9003) TaxID=240176 RepID=A8NR79_COPC7|nr:hypothetical protein CC1G_07142 [Coprinopsis cinerea okayama7\|eukprot:XP_001835718.1 hypothetical protein CC1G_07142 [Coprinopsis cinerea okayama7\
MALPPPSKDQAYCNVSVLEAGHLSCAENLLKQPCAPDVMAALPCLCFLLQHSSRKEKFLFDLGVRRDIENYPPAVAKSLQPGGVMSCEVPQDVVESLAKGGLAPDDIDYVGISHLHWDHIGDTSKFKKCTFILGAEGKSVLESSYPANPDSWYASDVPPPAQTRYLSPEGWRPIGPFPRTHDFYGDGSLFIVDAPGHLPGHINILARTSSDGSWVFLAGDSVHHWDIIKGEAKVAVGASWSPHFCIHQDLPKAEEHIEHIKRFNALPKTQVILGHDSPWYTENKGSSTAFFPGTIAPRKD